MAGDNNNLINRQSLSLLSIVGVWLLVGVPVWWKTTTVYRSSLPYAAINELKELENVNFLRSCNISVFDLAGDGILGHSLIKAPNFTVTTGQSTISVNSWIWERPASTRPDQSKSISDIVNGFIKEDGFTQTVGHYKLTVVPKGSINNAVSSTNERHVIVEYSSKERLKEDVEVALNSLCGKEMMTKLLSDSDTRESLRRVKVSPGYDISLILISSVDSAISEWNIEESTSDFLMPFLQDEDIGRLANFTVSSQMLYYTDIDFKTRFDEEMESHTVSSVQLPTMISNIEAKLGSSLSQWPRLTFVIYIPKDSQRPLLVKEGAGERSDAFLVPQWGGVIFYNNVQRDGNTVRVNMNETMPTIVRQLKLLLGFKEPQDCKPSSYCIHKWDFDHLLMVQTIERLLLAKQSLISLIELLDDVKNMVINDHIQHEVMESLSQLNKCLVDISEFHWESAHVACRIALHHAEVAFFDPSILALLYFPDDQKYAIYIPLFLPVGFPVLMSLIKFIKSWRQSRKEKTS